MFPGDPSSWCRPVKQTLIRWHRVARDHPWLRRFTLANRLLLSMAFLPTGLVKLLGRRFTILPTDNPIGFFFEAMYRTGPYWNFIGAVQIVAAVLLLFPGTAVVGALLFAPVAASILLITWGVGFGNTVFVAAGMVVSVGWLLLWDADRIVAASRTLTTDRGYRPLLAGAHPIETTGWVVGGLAGMGLWLSTRGFVPAGWRLPLLAAGVAAVVLVVLGWIVSSTRGDTTPTRRRRPS